MPTFPSPDDRRHVRPLSVHEQQALDGIRDNLSGDFVTVRLPRLRTVVLVAVLTLGLSIVVGATATWWALVALITVVIGLPGLLLFAPGQHQAR